MSDGYGAFDVKQLWQMVDSAKQGLAESTKQIGGWLRAQQMLDRHATALVGFREQLAAKWPPETNAASAAYLAEFDRLLTAVTQTAESSGMNASYIGYVADAIEQAHAKLKPIHDEYVSNEQKLAGYQAQLDAVGTAVGATRGSIVGALAKGGAELFTSPPVDDGRQQELLRQARQVMVPLSDTAQSATVRMQPPAVYVPPILMDEIYEPGTEFGSPSDGTYQTWGESGRAHSGAGTSPGGPSTSQPVSSPGPGPHAPVTAPPPGPDGSADPGAGDLPGRGAWDPPAHGTGPVLSGGGAHPVPPSMGPVGGGPAVGAPIVGGPPPSGGLGPAPGVIPSLGMPAVPGGGVPGGGAGSGVRTVPPSPVVGGSVGGLVAPVGTAQRVNPVGGVIGQQPGAVPGMVGGPQGRPASRSAAGEGQRWDPDNPWAVEEGVAPVIAPEAPRPVDPGPGVIGIDR